MVEWLKRRAYDQHGLSSKPTRTILLCPWERYFRALSPAWWSWQAVLNYSHISIKFQADNNILASPEAGGGGGGFTRPIPRDGGADQFRGIPIVGRLPTDGTRGPEETGCGRKWPDAEGLVQGSRARDVRDPVVQNHSCCKKESRLDQPCGDKS